MPETLIHLEGVSRAVQSDDTERTILVDIDLDIHAGEFVAIVGASGSGKSTLMNILGCLDRPTSGRYVFDGEDVSKLPLDELARLRRNRFGFIFQRYHLIPFLRAIDNVSLPAVYSWVAKHDRTTSAARLLSRLGLHESASLLPNKLSGGQQQRVSIARALINGSSVILADEPTGALDSRSGAEVMRILRELNRAGQTLIVVTHDNAIAAQADRIIEISGGRIVADRRGSGHGPENGVSRIGVGEQRECSGEASLDAFEAQAESQPRVSTDHAAGDRRVPKLLEWFEIVRVAVISLGSHSVQSCLTVLGIALGIAVLGVTNAAGEASTQNLMTELARFDTHSLIVYPNVTGRGQAQLPQKPLTADDADAITNTRYIDKASLHNEQRAVLRYGHVETNVTAHAVDKSFFDFSNISMLEGIGLNGAHVENTAQVVVIDQQLRSLLVLAGEDPCGKVITVNDVPLTVIGVAGNTNINTNFRHRPSVWFPYTALPGRTSADAHETELAAELRPGSSYASAKLDINRILGQRRGRKDLEVAGNEEYAASMARTQSIQNAFQALVALSTLIVGGIGIANVMIVSIANRTGEIGTRMAVGARTVDIRRQFMLEALMLCAAGGMLGVVIALGVVSLTPKFVPQLDMKLSATSVFTGFACSTLVGLVFGFFPARAASRLQPIDALTST